MSRDELLEKWQQGWRVLLDTLVTLDDSHLDRTVTIRRQPLTVLEALLRALAHVSYHVGQIVYAAKAARGDDWTYLSIPPGESQQYNANPTESGRAVASGSRLPGFRLPASRGWELGVGAWELSAAPFEVILFVGKEDVEAGE